MSNVNNPIYDESLVVVADIGDYNLCTHLSRVYWSSSTALCWG